MTLKTDIDQIAVDAGKLHDIVHGGPTAVVATDGSTVKSVAKAIADLEAQIVTEAGSYVDQCQDEVALATAQAQTATNQAAAAAGSALSAASVVAQDLSAIDRTVFASTTLVDAFLYDTSKDSDGGAWRKRCSHTSWEAETLFGNWLGSAANEAAARAISGATTGSYYYDTTAAVFYKLNAGSGVTQVYRGNARQFPAQVMISAEVSRVVIWDITQAGCPMWMVFQTTYSSSGKMVVAPAGYAPTSVAMLNGQLCCGSAGAGLSIVGFAADEGTRIIATGGYRFPASIASRNSELGATLKNSMVLVNGVVNDVAMTVLPSAPIDVATGLPVPTIAAATDAGVSVVKDDGNVWDIVSSSGGYGYVRKVLIEKGTGKILFTHDVAGWGRLQVRVHAMPSADVTFTYNTKSTSLEYYPAPIMSAGGDLPLFQGTMDIGMGQAVAKAIGMNVGLALCARNHAVPANGMRAFVTKDYPGAWQVGASKGLWLCDIVAETLTGTELITNGDFAAGTTGWSAVNSGSIAVASGELTVTNGASNNGTGEQAITTVAGKTYVVSATARIGTATPVYIVAGTTSGAFNLGASSTASASNVPVSLTFTATGTTTYIGLRNTSGSGLTGIFDNVFCRLADVDRSDRAKSVQAFGSLTKAVVASGAALIGYSGWSAANFLEQPYSSDLDFGTADLYVLAWVKATADGTVQQICIRGAYAGSYSGSMMALYMDGTCRMFAYLSDDGAATYDQVNSTGTYADGKWHLAAMVVRSAVLELWVDGGKLGQTAVSNANLGQTNTSAKLRIGCNPPGTSPLNPATCVALVRAGAYAPSSEQMRHIYETEKRLFEANAQCCLAGTSNAVTALAYDDETDLLHVGTSYGRSAFKGIVRVASEATPVGAIVALAAGAGVIAQAGASGADVYVPAYTLREELLRDAEQMAKFGQNLIAHDFTATASQTNFALPVGWEIVAVYQQGALKRETTSWTRSFDGFVWSAVLGTGATVSDWISILAKRV